MRSFEHVAEGRRAARTIEGGWVLLRNEAIFMEDTLFVGDTGGLIFRVTAAWMAALAR